MCFSAEASFTAAAILTGIGIASIRSVKDKNHYPLACVPFIFAIQQLSEGFVWLNIHSTAGGYVSSISVYVFLLFALIIWPLLIPIAMYFVEKEKIHKKILLGLIAFSLPFAIGAGYFLFSDQVTASSVNCSIDYVLQSLNPKLGNFFLIYYVLLTILPFYSTRNKLLWLLGTVLLFSLIMTFVFLRTTMVSTWCFFSALMSILILFIIRSLNKRNIKKAEQ